MVGLRLLLGRRAERPMMAGVAVGIFFANAAGDRNLLLSFFYAGINILEFILVARIAEWLGGRPFRLDSLGRVFYFFLAAAIGVGVDALAGVTAMSTLSQFPARPLEAYGEWFRSDFIGIIGLAPLLIGLQRTDARVPPRIHLEGMLVLSLLAVVSVLLFSATPSPDRLLTQIPLIPALFPLLLFIAARLPLVYASAAVAIITLIVVTTATAGNGRFSDPHLSLSFNVIFAQFLIASASVCSLALAALVAERRASEEHQRLLISQLDHRVKNSLTLMQAVVERSQESARSITDFVSSLAGRIRSMARTQSKLSAGRWQGLCLQALVRDELAPYKAAWLDDVSGPSIKLKPQAAQSISMVIHELATNAAKYGALSTPHGRVGVRWTIDKDAAGEEVLDLVWKESGGPPVTVPEREGFGTSTIRGLLPYEIGGRVELLFDPRGAVCHIRLPLLATVVGGEAGDKSKPAP